MTTQTRNEAADLLMEQVVAQIESAFPKYDGRSLALRERVREAIGSALDEALAAERRATVERIRERLPRFVETRYGYTPEKVLAVYREDLDAILDEEAAR